MDRDSDRNGDRDRGRYRVLVVDDDPEIVASLRALLDAEGYRVVSAGNGAAALAVLRREPVNLILSDIMMPEMDGVALLRRLRTSGDTTPVVLMSAAAMPSASSGDAQFLSKPFDILDVLTLVECLLAGGENA